MRRKEWLYFVLLPFVLAVFFCLMLFGTVLYFNPIREPQYIAAFVIESVGVTVFILIAVGVWGWIRYRLEKCRFRLGAEKKGLLVFFAILTILQIGFASQISMPLAPQCMILDGAEVCAWDFNVVASGAIDSINSGIDEGTLEYLHKCQNNIPLFALLKGVFAVMTKLGITNYQVVGNALSIVAINTALLLLYLTARKLGGTKKAFFALAVAVCVLPLSFLYIPTFYTDTLSLPFPILILYLYLKLREKKTLKAYMLSSVIIVLCVFVGSLIKMSVAIALIAAIIDAFMRTRRRWDRRRAAIFISVCVVLLAPMFAGYAALARTHVHSKADPSRITMPPSHYIMMGLGGDGRYSFSDDQKTYLGHSDRESATAFNIAEIKKRLSNMGPAYVLFLYRKALVTWSDGYYEAYARLTNTGYVTDEFKPSALQKVLTYTGEQPLTVWNFSRAVQLLLLIALLLGSVTAIYDKRAKKLAVLRLSVFGIALFLLIWETNSRYLLNFLPIIVVLAAFTWWDLIPKVRQLSARLFHKYFHKRSE